MNNQQIKNAVLNNVFEICQNDADYLSNLIEWAYRDYTKEDFLDDFLTMGLDDKDN